MFCCWKDWIDNVPFGCWYGAFVSMKGRPWILWILNKCYWLRLLPHIWVMGMIGHVLMVPQIDWTKTTPKGVPSQGSFTSATSSKCTTESKSVFVCVCLRECGREVNWKVCLNSVGTARFENVYEQYPHIEFFWENQDTFYSAHHELSLSDEIEIITVLYFSFGFLLVPIFVIWEFRWHNRWSTYIPSSPFQGKPTNSDVMFDDPSILDLTWLKTVEGLNC